MEREQLIQLIEAYLDGDISVCEKLYSVLETDEDARNVFSSMQNKWLSYSFSTNKALNNLQNKINKKNNKQRITRNSWVYLTISACLVVAVLLFGQHKIEEPIIPFVSHCYEAQNGVMNITLPDGSSVILEKGSRLVSKSTREVSLIGSACFDVVPDSLHHFIVGLSNESIIVKGTKFHVDYSDISRPISIELVRGAIEFNTSDGRIVSMSPGDRVKYSSNDGNLSVDKINLEDFEALMDGCLEYKDMTISSMVVQLQSLYGAVINIDSFLNDSKKCYSISLHNREKLETVLSALAILTESNLTFDGGMFYLNHHTDFRCLD